MIHDLIDIDAFEYAFINEEIAQKICHKLKLTLISLFRLKKVFNFEKTEIKLIIHQILLKMILQNHSKLFAFLFIIKIKQHSLILNKLWINRHKMIFNIINDECYFTSNHCDHVETSFLLFRLFVFQRLFNSNKQFNKTLYFSFFDQLLTSLSFVNVQKYQIFQRRTVSTSSRLKSSRSIVEDSTKKKQSSEKSLNSNSKYVIDVTSTFENLAWNLILSARVYMRTNVTWRTLLLLTFDLLVHICSLNQIFSFLLSVILLVRHDLWHNIWSSSWRTM